MCGIILVGLRTILKKIKISKRKIDIISIIFLILFVFVTDFTSSVIRASIMAGMGIIASLLHRKNNMINSMCVAYLITIIQNPYNIYNISVLLSYGGVIGIILYLKPIENLLDKVIKTKSKIINYIKGIVSVSLSVQIIIIPIMIMSYNTISLTFLISNILTRIFN